MMHQHTHHRRRMEQRILSLAILCMFPFVSSLEFSLTHRLDGSFSLTSDRTGEWAWSDAPIENGRVSSVHGVNFSAVASTADDVEMIQDFASTLPPDLLDYALQQGYQNDTRDSLSVLSTEGDAPSVWVLKSYVNRPWVQFVSSAFICEKVIFTSVESWFTCSSTVDSIGTVGSYTWIANITSTVSSFGVLTDQDAASTTVKVTITTNPSSTQDPSSADSFVNQLLAIAYTKASENIRLNKDIIGMRNSDDDRRSHARIAVGFLWVFIMFMASFAVFVSAVWFPWAIPCVGTLLLNHRTIGALFAMLAGLFIAVGMTEGLAGFLILLLVMMFTTAGINIVYCCQRARNRTLQIHPVADSLTGTRTESTKHGGGGDYTTEGHTRDAPTEHDALFPLPSPHGDTMHRSDEPSFTVYPNALGERQRTYISYGAMLFLICAVVCVAIFGLWDCTEYKLWDRQSSTPTSEFMPQAIAKATFLVYAFDGFANRIKMNNIFFDVSTQWCGSHYSTQLNTDAQKKTSIQIAFIQKYSIDMSQFVLSSYSNYSTVNHWFIRDLRPGVRPLSSIGDNSVIINPCDARIMAFARIPDDSFIWIKDSSYSVQGLIGEKAYTRNPGFQDSAMALIRLAPQDYHQFHSPVDGTVKMIYTIEGSYHSVNADGMTSANYAIYNQRTVVLIDTTGYANIGEVAYVAIGALCVGSITIKPDVDDFVSKGESIGYFQFGGSTIAVLFQQGTVQFDEDILQHSRQKVETLVQLGTTLARVR